MEEKSIQSGACGPAGKRKKILVVEDAAVNRAILQKIFSAEYALSFAPGGAEALELLHAAPDFDLVLLDIFMPKVNGFAVLEAMQQDAALSRIPVIAVTASGEAEHQIRALDTGAADIILKPYQPQVIQHRVSNILRRLESERIAERSRMVEQQLHLMETDAKTGLYNKMAFCRHVREILEQNPETTYVILRWDIDHFRAFNEIYGMAQGDALLEGTGRYYQHETSAQDGVVIAGHWHADCFVTLRKKGAFDPERIMETIEQRAAKDYPDFEFVTRIGMYEITDRSLDVAMMCDRAMLALRSVKNNFKSRYAWYDESMRRTILEEQEISSEARVALAEEQFAVYFQPQYYYAQGALSGVEALVRWIHPQKGVISPGRFIPLFEENGFICKLDQYVWGRACYYLRRWLDAGLKPVPVSLNVSRQDIYNTNLCGVFQKLLETYNLTPELLHLEITESAYMENPDQLVRVVRQLQGCGFHVEMDDFGSGYSSLNTLKDVPVDTLKLDMKFLSEDEEDTRGGSILSSIVHMAHAISLPVIAEGVETRRQADYLKSVGCQYMQGYLFAQPMPAEEYEKLLRQSHVAAPDKRFSTEIGGAADFLSATTQSTLLFNSFVGGAAIVEYENGITDILRVNDRFLEILDTSYDEYVKSSQRFLDRVAPEHHSTFLQMLESAVHQGRETECEVRSLPSHEGGKTSWLHVRARFLTHKAGAYLLYLAIEDISVRMNLLRHNTKLSQRLSAIVRDLPGAVYNFEITPQGIKTSYFNDQAADMFGFTREEYSRRFADAPLLVVHPEDRPALESALQQAVAGTLPTLNGRFRHICRSGEWRWVQITGSLSHRTEQIVFASAILMDVEREVENERLNAAQAQELDRQRTLFQLLYSTIPCGIMQYTIHGEEMQLNTLNDAAWQIFGYQSKMQYLESLPGQPRLKDVHPQDREMLDASILAVLKYDRRMDFNHRILRLDGSTRWVHAQLQKVELQDGNEALQVVFTDITDQFRKDLDHYSSALLGMYEETYEVDTEQNLCTLRASRIHGAGELGRVTLFTEEVEKICAETLAPEDVPVVREHLRLASRDDSEYPRTLEYRYHTDSREIRWASMTILHVAGSQYLICCKDITPEKRASALEQENMSLQAANSERKAEEERNRIFMDAMGVLVFEYDPTTDTMNFSSRAEGEAPVRAPEKSYLRSLLENPRIAPADRQNLKTKIEAALNRPMRQSIEYMAARFGSLSRCRSDFVSVADAQNRVYRIVGVISPIQDKTEQRLIAEELMQMTGRRSGGEQYQAQVAEQLLQIFNDAADRDKAVNRVLDVIGRKMDVSRVYVTQVEEEGAHCIDTFEWREEGAAPKKQTLREFHYPEALRPYSRFFGADGLFLVPNVSQESEAMRAVLKPQGTRSMAQCAIFVGGVFRGYVGFDNCVQPHVWTETQVHTLVLLTRLITAYVYCGAGRMPNTAAQEAQNAAEQALLERYRMVAEQAQCAVIDWDRAQKTLYFSERAHSYALSLDQQDGKLKNISPADAVQAEDVPMLMALHDEMRAGAVHAMCELRLKLCAGGYRWASLRADALRDEGGNIQRLVICIWDIQQQKTAEIELAEVHRRTRELLLQLPVGILVYQGKSSCPAYCNERTKKIFGVTQAEIEQSVAEGTTTRLIPDIRCLAAHPEQSFAPGEFTVQRLHLQRKDGSWFWMSAICHNLCEAD